MECVCWKLCELWRTKSWPLIDTELRQLFRGSFGDVGLARILLFVFRAENIGLLQDVVSHGKLDVQVAHHLTKDQKDILHKVLENVYEEHSESNEVCVVYGAFLERAEKRYKEALNVFAEAAGRGYGMAENYVGYFHYFGKGVEESPEEAFAWFEKALGKGCMWAELNVGDCLLSGIGTERDVERGVAMLEECCRLGCAEAHELLGDYYHFEEEDLDRALEHYREAAKQDYLESLVHCGDILLYSKEDTMQALEYYTRAADMGSKRGCQKAGGVLETLGDRVAAVHYVEKAMRIGKDNGAYQAWRRLTRIAAQQSY